MFVLGFLKIECSVDVAGFGIGAHFQQYGELKTLGDVVWNVSLGSRRDGLAPFDIFLT